MPLHRLRRLGHVRRQDLLRCEPDERRSAGQQLIGQHAHRIDVHAVIEVRIGGRLLRRHVGRSTERHAGRRELLASRRLAHRLRHAEVHH